MKSIFIAAKEAGLKTDWFEVLSSEIQKRFGNTKPISIAFVDKKEMTRLNTVYRNKKSVTDVLSFNLDEEPSTVLGEVILCPEVLKKQAKQKDHSINKEFKILLIHGTLHLFGLNHENKKDARLMESLEKEILKQVTQ